MYCIQRVIAGQWEPSEREGAGIDNPEGDIVTYARRKAARAALNEHMNAMEEAADRGFMQNADPEKDYRVGSCMYVNTINSEGQKVVVLAMAGDVVEFVSAAIGPKRIELHGFTATQAILIDGVIEMRLLPEFRGVWRNGARLGSSKEPLKIWTMFYTPFVMGGSTWQPRFTKVDRPAECHDVGHGFSVYIVRSPVTDRFYAVELTTGGLVENASSAHDLILKCRKNIEAATKEEVQLQLNAAAKDAARAEEKDGESFWEALAKA